MFIYICHVEKRDYDQVRAWAASVYIRDYDYGCELGRGVHAFLAGQDLKKLF